MCCISGAFAYKNNSLDLNKLSLLLSRGSIRGEDAYGYCYRTTNGLWNYKRRLGKPDPQNFTLKNTIDVFLANNRAEPTTEHIENINELTDLQPYCNENWVVVHNGTIANDKELCKKWGIESNSCIDTSIMPFLLDKVEKDADSMDIVGFIEKEIIGSYSFCFVNKKKNYVILMNNYQPLYIMKDNGAFYFASLPEVLDDKNFIDRFSSEIKLEKVPPYSAIVLDLNTFEMKFKSLERKRNKKCLVVCSGGLDSTVAATKLRNEGYDISLIHFLYECKAQTKETEAVKNIAKDLDVPLVFFPIDFYKNIIGGNKLTDDNAEITEGEKGVEYAHEWVPARNLVFTSIAIAYAEAHGFSYIALGTNLEEQAAYPDNSIEFSRGLTKLMPYFIQNGGYIEILSPLSSMMKHQIYGYGRKINAPIHHSWSCYKSGKYHCGVCGPCIMRKLSAKINGMTDNIKYLV